MPKISPVIIVLLALAGCSPSAPNMAEPSVVVTNTPAAPPPPARPQSLAPAKNSPPAPGTPGGLPDDRTPISEGRINPKSAQGAAQIVQLYGILLHERKFTEAYALWGDGGASGMTPAQFAQAFAKYAEVNALVGGPGETDGAAGSIYVTVPLQLYGTLASTGKRFNLIGPITLRRVNDVDGATPAQLRWHITDSALKPTL